MTAHQLLTAWLLFALMLSTGAFIFSWAALRRAGRSWAARRIAKLELEGLELLQAVEGVRESMKKMNARQAMSIARAKKQELADDDTPDDPWAQRPGESSAAWKERLRRGPLRAGLRPS